MKLRTRVAVLLTVAALGVTGVQSTASAAGNRAVQRDQICFDVGVEPDTIHICLPT